MGIVVLVEFRAGMVLIRDFLVRLRREIAFSRGNIVGSQHTTAESGGLHLFELLHSLAVLFVQLLDFLLLAGSF